MARKPPGKKPSGRKPAEREILLLPQKVFRGIKITKVLDKKVARALHFEARTLNAYKRERIAKIRSLDKGDRRVIADIFRLGKMLPKLENEIKFLKAELDKVKKGKAKALDEQAVKALLKEAETERKHVRTERELIEGALSEPGERVFDDLKLTEKEQLKNLKARLEKQFEKDLPKENLAEAVETLFEVILSMARYKKKH